MLFKYSKNRYQYLLKRYNYINKYNFFHINTINDILKTHEIIDNDGMNDRGEIMIPNNKKYNNVLIFMHGLGDTSKGWSPIIPYSEFKNTKFIFPTASSKKITLNFGYKMPAWWDLKSLDRSNIDDIDNIIESRERIYRIINNEIENNNISINNINIGGFSQGGALALDVALRYKYNNKRLNSITALSCYLPLINQWKNDIKENKNIDNKYDIDIYWAHGINDDVIQLKWAKQCYEFINNNFIFNNDIIWNEYQCGHELHPQELLDFTTFLKKYLK